MAQLSQQHNWARKPVTLLLLQIPNAFLCLDFYFKKFPFDRFTTNIFFFQRPLLYQKVTIVACPEPTVSIASSCFLQHKTH